MATKAKGIRISDQLDREITYESETRGKSWSAITNELLEEAIRMRRVPGIVFMDGPTGRRAALASGLDIWEIVATWQHGGRSYDLLQQNYPWLTETQLRATLAYYELYPQEINSRLEREAQLTPERVWQEFPFLKPRNL